MPFKPQEKHSATHREHPANFAFPDSDPDPQTQMNPDPKQ
jgi:hypothetical protein